MAAAEELFGRQGFVQTTVARITRAAGYAKGSFYRHWDSKDALFLQIVERKLADYRARRDARLKKARSLDEVMHVIWDFLEDMTADRQWAKVFLEFTVHAARDPQRRRELKHSRHRLSEQVFAGLVEDFVDTDHSLEKLGALNTVLFEGFLVHNALETGVLELADVRDAAVELVLARGRRADADAATRQDTATLEDPCDA